MSVPITEALTPKDVTAYYQENLDLVNYGGFQILGHLGIFKRYMTSYNDAHCKPLIEEIFRQIISKGIALEVNSSPLSRTLQNVIPEPEYLRLDREMGGELITLGSDSHEISQFDFNYDKGLEIVKSCGFKNLFAWKNGQWDEIGFS